jgi:hypothetical protein
MQTLRQTFTVDRQQTGKIYSDAFGLINAADFDRSELYGYEVDLCGNVIVPELYPPCGGESPRETFPC